MQDADAVAVTTTDDPKARQYTFRFRSRCACIGGCGGGAGCGPFCVTVLLVLTIGMGYLALGMAYNKFAKGATTIEVCALVLAVVVVMPVFVQGGGIEVRTFPPFRNSRNFPQFPAIFRQFSGNFPQLGSPPPPPPPRNPPPPLRDSRPPE